MFRAPVSHGMLSRAVGGGVAELRAAPSRPFPSLPFPPPEIRVSTDYTVIAAVIRGRNIDLSLSAVRSWVRVYSVGGGCGREGERAGSRLHAHFFPLGGVRESDGALE